MTHASEKQTSFIAKLAAARAMTPIEAVNTYGLGLRTPNSLSLSEASEVIAWLQQPTITKEVREKADAERQAFLKQFGLSD